MPRRHRVDSAGGNIGEHPLILRASLPPIRRPIVVLINVDHPPTQQFAQLPTILNLPTHPRPQTLSVVRDPNINSGVTHIT
jgi:hypothetical protein